MTTLVHLDTYAAGTGGYEGHDAVCGEQFPREYTTEVGRATCLACLDRAVDDAEEQMVLCRSRRHELTTPIHLRVPVVDTLSPAGTIAVSSLNKRTPGVVYLTDRGAFDSEGRPIPPRTVFVNPAVLHAIARRIGGTGAAPDNTPIWSATFQVVGDDSWRIVPDPDCPIDYAWPESAPPEVAEVVRQGIEDARKATP